MAVSTETMCHVTKLKQPESGFVNVKRSSCTQIASTVTRPQLNRAPLGCGEMGDPTNLHQLCDDVKMGQNLTRIVSSILLNRCH